VKGHSGDPDNERVDVLARTQAQRLRAAAPVR
jgi:ribonuclease HI